MSSFDYRQSLVIQAAIHFSLGQEGRKQKVSITSTVYDLANDVGRENHSHGPDRTL